MPAKTKKPVAKDRVAKVYQAYLDNPKRKDPGVVYAQSKVDGVAKLVYLGEDSSEDRQRLTEILAFRMAQEAVEIAGPDATDLEILLATRIVATELLATTHEKSYYGPGSFVPKTLEVMDRRIDLLNRRIQQGAVALARVRRLRTAPGPTVNMAAVLVSDKGRALPEAVDYPQLKGIRQVEEESVLQSRVARASDATS